MIKSFIFLTISMLFCWKGIAQVNQEMLDEVLRSKNKDKEYTFKRTEFYGEVSISVSYLGEIATKNHNYEVITYSVYYKKDDYFHSAILFFNNSNDFLGKYSFGKASKIIAKIIGQKIIFKNTESYCDSSIKNELDISGGLPEIFHTKCDNKFGDGRILEDEY